MSSYLPSSLLPGNTFQFIFVTSATTTANYYDISYYNDFVQNIWDQPSSIRVPVCAALDIPSITWKCICSTAGHCPEKGTITNARDNVVSTSSTDLSGIYTLANMTSVPNPPKSVSDNTGKLFNGVVGVHLSHKIDINEKGELASSGGGNVWTGSNSDGTGSGNELGSYAVTNKPRATFGEYTTKHNPHWIDHDKKVKNASFPLYALSEVLTMPPIFPPTPPYPPSWPVLPVNPSGKARFPFPAPIPKSPFCRPICLINIRDFSVNQPAPPEESTKMRHAKRIKGRGWRKMSLKQYNEMKRGGLPFLGTCYQKKNH